MRTKKQPPAMTEVGGDLHGRRAGRQGDAVGEHEDFDLRQSLHGIDEEPRRQALALLEQDRSCETEVGEDERVEEAGDEHEEAEETSRDGPSSRPR